jgi:hypothetical protein
MATLRAVLQRPAPDADFTSSSGFRTAGLITSVMGLAAITVALIGNLVALGEIGEEGTALREILAWTFGATTIGLAMLKLGIATVLIGIIVRLWMRVESVKTALATLRANVEPEIRTGDLTTDYGPAVASASVPAPLPIHRMARVLWLPMLLMGMMAVAIGFVLSLIQSGTADSTDFRDLGAYVQGLQFMGEGLVLSGISFLLGTILASLRSGGGEVQESLGVTVKTLKMPASAKLFILLMMMGMTLSIVQFVLYIVAIGVDNPGIWFTWLGPLRELSLGLLLSGIVLALYTIGTVLGFQFTRIHELVTEGN